MVEHGRGRPTEVLFFATLLLSYSISIGHSNDLMFVGSVAGSVLQTEHKFKPLSLFYPLSLDLDHHRSDSAQREICSLLGSSSYGKNIHIP